MNILFVSLSNTCRSPMAAAICEYLCRTRGIDVTCDCAGIDTDAGMGMSIGAAAALARMGLDAESHRTRQVSAHMVDNADAILVMEEAERKLLVSQFPNCEKRVYLLTEYAGGKGDIPDPFGMNDVVYDACADRIRTCVESILEDLR